MKEIRVDFSLQSPFIWTWDMLYYNKRSGMYGNSKHTKI